MLKQTNYLTKVYGLPEGWKLAAYERAGVREVWLVHPTDQVVTVYEQVAGGFGRPAISEMRGELAVRFAKVLR